MCASQILSNLPIACLRSYDSWVNFGHIIVIGVDPGRSVACQYAYVIYIYYNKYIIYIYEYHSINNMLYIR